jgi:hypothetical protein
MQNRRGDGTIRVGDRAGGLKGFNSSPSEAPVIFSLAEIQPHIFLSLLVFA